MIGRIFEQVIEAISAPASADTDNSAREDALKTATAVLMIDVARADHVFDATEFDRVLELCEEHFQLGPDAAGELVDVAHEKAENLVSAHEFTRLLHKHLDEEEKASIVGMLWQVAYADGRLDKYEDSLVRKISDLLYVSRGRVMRLKDDARRAVRNS